MKKLLFLALVISMTSCLSTRKYSEVINSQASIYESAEEDFDWLHIYWDDQSGPKGHKLTQTKKSFLPFIFFWKWHTTHIIDLDRNYSANKLKQALVNNIQNTDLKEKLGGASLYIRLINLPGQFQYDKGGVLAFVMVYFISAKVNEIRPIPIDLEYEYKIIPKDTTEYTTTGSITSEERGLKKNKGGTKNFTAEYLEQYNLELERMSAELLHRINTDVSTLKLN